MTDDDADRSGHPSAWTCRSGEERVVRATEYNTGGLQHVGISKEYLVSLRTRAGDSPHRARERIATAVQADDLFKWRDDEGVTRLTVTTPAGLVDLVAFFYAREWREAIGEVIEWERAYVDGPRPVVIGNCNHALAGLDRQAESGDEPAASGPVDTETSA